MIVPEWPTPHAEAIPPQLEALRNMHLNITLNVAVFTDALLKRL